MDGFLIDKQCRLYQRKDTPACPPSCNLCQKACPTKALCGDYTPNPIHCVSFITTFAKGAIPPGIEEEQLGSWMVGCDACQDACPFNREHDWSTGEDFQGLDALVELMQPKNILLASEDELAEQICPLTSNHILPKDASTLKINAKRVLRNKKKLHSGL